MNQIISEGKQLAAARSLIGWTTDDLAQRAGIARQTISSIEGGNLNAQPKTIDKIISSINRAGVIFTSNGGVDKASLFKTLSGDNWFSELLEDAYETLKDSDDKEFLIFAGNNSVSPPEVIERFRTLREVGVIIREMVREGDTYLMADIKYYRWIPEEFYKNFVTIIYADKVCNDFGDHAVLIQNKHWADAERNKFNMLWSQQPELNIESTSNVRY